MTASPPHAVAPVSAVYEVFRTQPSAYPLEDSKPDVAPTCGSVRQSYSTEAGAPAGGFRRRNEPQAAKQPAMDLSRDKNAEEMKWSPLEMGAAMQAHGA